MPQWYSHLISAKYASFFAREDGDVPKVSFQYLAGVNAYMLSHTLAIGHIPSRTKSFSYLYGLGELRFVCVTHLAVYS